MQNELFNYVYKKSYVDNWRKGDEIITYCPICESKGPTFTANLKTKKYYCSSCEHQGYFRFIHDKKGTLGIRFDEIY